MYLIEPMMPELDERMPQLDSPRRCFVRFIVHNLLTSSIGYIPSADPSVRAAEEAAHVLSTTPTSPVPVAASAFPDQYSHIPESSFPITAPPVAGPESDLNPLPDGIHSNVNASSIVSGYDAAAAVAAREARYHDEQADITPVGSYPGHQLPLPATPDLANRGVSETGDYGNDEPSRNMP